MSHIICAFYIFVVFISTAAAGKEKSVKIRKVIDDGDIGEIPFGKKLEIKGAGEPPQAEGKKIWEEVRTKLRKHKDAKIQCLADRLSAVYTVDDKMVKHPIEYTNTPYDIPAEIHISTPIPLRQLEITDISKKTKLNTPFEYLSNITQMSGEDIWNRVAAAYKKDERQDIKELSNKLVTVQINGVVDNSVGEYVTEIEYSTQLYNLETNTLQTYIHVTTSEWDTVLAKYRDEMQHKSYTELHVALKNGNPFIARDLIVSGDFNINARTTDGFTSLYFAVEAGSDVLVRVLLEKEADPKANGKIKTPAGTECNLLYLVISTPSIPTSVGKLLIANGADVNEKVKYDNGDWDTLLHVAVKTRYTVSWQGWASPLSDHKIKFLANSGAAVNAKNKMGKTPIQLAIESKWYYLVRVLIETGKVNKETLNETVKDEEGNDTTALHQTVKDEQDEIVKLMVDLGADPTKKVAGKTPTDMANMKVDKIKKKLLKALKKHFFSSS